MTSARRSNITSALYPLALTVAAALICSEPARAESTPAPASTDGGQATVVVVVGAGGTEDYAAGFKAAAEHWRKAATGAGARFFSIGLESNSTTQAMPDRQNLEMLLADHVPNGHAPLWVIFLGHGTFDARTAKLNLRGPDVTAQELASWMAPLARPLVFINTASASAPFLKALSGPNRIVVTATKTGHELGATRFPRLFSETITDPSADLDRDGRVSLFEAFVVASRRVEAAFTDVGRLASEHALLDDNGDGLGTPAKFFEGVREARAPDRAVPLDGQRARATFLAPADTVPGLSPALIRRREALEGEVLRLRSKRETLPQTRYYARLEALLLELARIYERAEKGEPPRR